MSERDDWQEIDRLFDAALDRPPAERRRWLAAHCPDPAVRARVERLLARAGEGGEAAGLTPGGALEGGMAEAIASDPGAAGGGSNPGREAAAGDRIAGYRLIRPLGRGGMGEVWLAEQQEPVRRRVAVKLVKQGMDTREVMARFESERQALALMSHPCIARVYDAGATAAGRPFFVMEHVAGEAMTDYCDRRRLDTGARLELFLQVCEGIQHAHQKGIIHRDIKPSNVLVTEESGVPLPKIIDFGIARAVGGSLTGATVFTALGQVIGTPEYMSPEQASLQGVDIDTRSDVYSLGVLLYELLVGRRPVDADDLRTAAFDELLRRIRELDPPRPSARLTTLGAASRDVAARRGTEPSALVRRLRHDLDWIVMKALARERERRYASPGALADDLRRHLRDEPVVAGPPSAAYRLRKLVRRHRVGVAAGALALLALMAGVLVASWQAVRARRAERAAVMEARASREIADFLIGLFEVSDPGAARGETVTARELLEAGGRKVTRELAGQPAVRARVMGVVGDIDRRLGLYDEARPLLQAALEIQAGLAGEEHPDTAAAVHRLARLEVDAGDDAAAEPLLRRALDLYGRGPGPGSPEAADVKQDLADLMERAGRYDEAETLLVEVLAVRREAFGESDPRLAGALNGLAVVYGRTGRQQKAEAAYRQALAVRESALGPDHPDLIYTLASLAALMGEMGRHDESLELNRRALAIAEQVYGERHRATASALANLAACYGRMGRLEDVLATEERALAVKEEIFGPDHVEVAKSCKNMGQACLLLGRLDEAEAWLRRALDSDRAAVGEVHLLVAWDRGALGRLHARQARYDEALEQLDRALEILEQTVGASHPEAVMDRVHRGRTLARMGRLEEAEADCREALRLAKAGPGLDSPYGQIARNGLGVVLLQRGRAGEARRLQEEVLVLRQDRLGPEHPAVGVTLSDLADAEAALDETESAEEHYRQALAIAEAAHGPGHPEAATALHGLGRLLAATGRRDEAAAALEQALAIRRDRLGPGHPETRETAAALARARTS